LSGCLEAADNRGMTSPSGYLAVREAFVAERSLTIDCGRRHGDRRTALRTLVSDPVTVLERHRRDVRAGADVVTTATWGVAAASLLSPQPDRWMTVARRGVRLARLAVAAQRREGEVAVAFAIDAGLDTPQSALAMARISRLLNTERPDLVIVDARSAQQPSLEATVRALDTTRLPVWLSLPCLPQSIDWLERRGKRLRVIDSRLLEITRW
jgi:S-methylmethionine-dependent homocysteine/selenocysteine methylase